MCSRFCWVSIFYYDAVLGSSSVSRKSQWGFFHCFCGIYICSVGLCISGIFDFDMQCVLHIYIILDLYLFLAASFLLQCVLHDSSLITYQLLCWAWFCWLNCSRLQCILQCNVMCCSALQAFHCSLLAFWFSLFELFIKYF